ncbi:MAG: DUF4397 domain-containing protein [Gemmatimonadales bacterium]|nr:DUF4397 domain-containing protein [Gemmatimonadales bacterium]
MRTPIRMGTATIAWALASTCVGQRIELPIVVDPTGSAWIEEASAAGVAQVRFVNGIVDMGTMEVIAGDHLAFGATAFGGETGYAEVGARSARFQLRSADGRVIAELAGPLDETLAYTLVAARGASGEPVLSVIPGRPVAITPASRRVRGT